MTPSERVPRRVLLPGVLAAVLSILWLALFLWAARRAPSNVARVHALLEWLCPLGCVLSMGILVLGILGQLLSLRGRFPPGWVRATGLFCILAASAVLRFAMIPRTERVYYDEHCYQQLARGMAAEGRLRLADYGLIDHGEYASKSWTYPHWPAGWPTLLAVYGKVVGGHREALPYLNFSLSLLTLIAVSGVAWTLWPHHKAWLFAAALYGCAPDNIIWSLTTASETSGALWITLSLLCAISFAKTTRKTWGYLLAGSVAVAVYTRNELVLLLPACTLLIVCLGGVPAARRALGPGTILLVLLLPYSLHLGVTLRGYDQYLLFEDAVFSVQHVGPNLLSLGEHLRQEPVALAILCLVAASLWTIRSKKVVLPLGAWLLSIVVLSSLHFAARYSYPGGSRFSLAWLPTACVLAGYSLSTVHARIGRFAHPRIAECLAGILFLLVLSWSALYARWSDQATSMPRTDVSFLRACMRGIPCGSLVVCSNPSVVIAEGVSSVSVYRLVENAAIYHDVVSRYSDRVYFYDCPTLSPVAQDEVGKAAIQQLLTTFQARILSEQTDQTGRRVFYQLGP